MKRIPLFVAAITTLSILVATAGPAASATKPLASTNISYGPKGLPPIGGSSQARKASPATGLCMFESCYYYANMAQGGFTANGVSVKFTQAQPKVGPNDFHSLTELWVASEDQKQIIEVGWTVEKNAKAALFVYHWVNGKGTCYNGCGFVPVSTKHHAGEPVKVGQTGSYSVQFKNNQWLVGYAGSTLGYFPASLWKGKFTGVHAFQISGEVSAATAGQPHSQMGNGILGTSSKSASVSDLKLLGVNAPTTFQYFSKGAPTKYKVGLFNPSCTNSCGMHYGGPGF